MTSAVLRYTRLLTYPDGYEFQYVELCGGKKPEGFMPYQVLAVVPFQDNEGRVISQGKKEMCFEAKNHLDAAKQVPELMRQLGREIVAEYREMEQKQRMKIVVPDKNGYGKGRF